MATADTVTNDFGFGPEVNHLSSFLSWDGPETVKQRSCCAVQYELAATVQGNATDLAFLDDAERRFRMPRNFAFLEAKPSPSPSLGTPRPSGLPGQCSFGGGATAHHVSRNADKKSDRSKRLSLIKPDEQMRVDFKENVTATFQNGHQHVSSINGKARSTVDPIKSSQLRRPGGATEVVKTFLETESKFSAFSVSTSKSKQRRALVSNDRPPVQPHAPLAQTRRHKNVKSTFESSSGALLHQSSTVRQVHLEKGFHTPKPLPSPDLRASAGQDPMDTAARNLSSAAQHLDSSKRSWLEIKPRTSFPLAERGYFCRKVTAVASNVPANSAMEPEFEQRAKRLQEQTHCELSESATANEKPGKFISLSPENVQHDRVQATDYQVFPSQHTKSPSRKASTARSENCGPGGKPVPDLTVKSDVQSVESTFAEGQSDVEEEAEYSRRVPHNDHTLSQSRISHSCNSSKVLSGGNRYIRSENPQATPAAGSGASHHLSVEGNPAKGPTNYQNEARYSQDRETEGMTVLSAVDYWEHLNAGQRSIVAAEGQRNSKVHAGYPQCQMKFTTEADMHATDSVAADGDTQGTRRLEPNEPSEDPSQRCETEYSRRVAQNQYTLLQAPNSHSRKSSKAPSTGKGYIRCADPQAPTAEAGANHGRSAESTFAKVSTNIQNEAIYSRSRETEKMKVLSAVDYWEHLNAGSITSADGQHNSKVHAEHPQCQKKFTTEVDMYTTDSVAADGDTKGTRRFEPNEPSQDPSQRCETEYSRRVAHNHRQSSQTPNSHSRKSSKALSIGNRYIRCENPQVPPAEAGASHRRSVESTFAKVSTNILNETRYSRGRETEGRKVLTAVDYWEHLNAGSIAAVEGQINSKVRAGYPQCQKKSTTEADVRTTDTVAADGDTQGTRRFEPNEPSKDPSQRYETEHSRRVAHNDHPLSQPPNSHSRKLSKALSTGRRYIRCEKPQTPTAEVGASHRRPIESTLAKVSTYIQNKARYSRTRETEEMKVLSAVDYWEHLNAGSIIAAEGQRNSKVHAGHLQCQKKFTSETDMYNTDTIAADGNTQSTRRFDSKEPSGDPFKRGIGSRLFSRFSPKTRLKSILSVGRVRTDRLSRNSTDKTASEEAEEISAHSGVDEAQVEFYDSEDAYMSFQQEPDRSYIRRDSTRLRLSIGRRSSQCREESL